MKKFDGFLLVSDIDGTLAEERFVPPANIRAIGKFVADGGQVVLATGRSPQSSVPVAKKLGCSALVIANNGAVVYDAQADQIVLQHTLDCHQITAEIIEKFDVGAMYYCGDELWLLKDNFEMTRLINSEQLTVKSKCDGAINKVIFGGEPAVLDEIEEYFKSSGYSGGDMSRSGPTIVEILPKGVNKGSAMTDIAKKLGIAKDKIFVAGNYYNDIDMIKQGAITCAPSDSPENLKEMVDYIACPCIEGAVADFIDYLYKIY